MVDVWTRTADGWRQTDTHRDPVSGGYDWFGYRLTADQGRAVIASPGGLLAYERVGTTWTYRSTVTETGVQQLVLPSDLLVVSEPGVFPDGEAVIETYRRTGDRFSLQQTLPTPEGLPMKTNSGTTWPSVMDSL